MRKLSLFTEVSHNEKWMNSQSSHTMKIQIEHKCIDISLCSFFSKWTRHKLHIPILRFIRSKKKGTHRLRFKKGWLVSSFLNLKNSGYMGHIMFSMSFAEEAFKQNI